jgi:hypothetical protein
MYFQNRIQFMGLLRYNSAFALVDLTRRPYVKCNQKVT